MRGAWVTFLLYSIAHVARMYSMIFALSPFPHKYAIFYDNYDKLQTGILSNINIKYGIVTILVY